MSNPNNIGTDDQGNPDGTWWGSSNTPSHDLNNPGGTHHTMFTDDGQRASFETDSNGYYVAGSGHTTDSDGNHQQWSDAGAQSPNEQ